MNKLDSNITQFLIISVVIHIGLLISFGNRKEQASLQQEQPKSLMIELATLSPADIANEQSKQRRPTETSKRRDAAIQQTPDQADGARSQTHEQRALSPPNPAAARQPIPTPTAIQKRSPNTSPQWKGSDRKTPQTQQADKQQDQTHSNKNMQKGSNGQPNAQQTKNNPMGASSAIKPRRVVQCLSCPRPRYPQNALQQGVEGEPRVLITINSSGRVQKVKLERSSGNPDIDRAALDAGRRSRFRAVTGGARVPVSYSVVIRGSQKHKQAVQKKEKQRYTLPTMGKN